uniref:Phosphoglycolate phosphatase n=1 Tax=Providencia stuartii TaxID=588 RepID=A0AAI9D754_PROST|nr:hypothetical protein [Providencia stuartii]
MKKTHIIWDWNGTLLDDVNISLFAANQVFISLDIKPLTLNEYRQYYSVPIQKFYHNVLGRTPTKIEWKKLGIFLIIIINQRLEKRNCVRMLLKLYSISN